MNGRSVAVNMLYISLIDFTGKFFSQGPVFSRKISHGHSPGPSDKLLDKVPGFLINIAYFVLSARKDWLSFVYNFYGLVLIPEACFGHGCFSFDTQRSAQERFIEQIQKPGRNL